MACVLPKQGIPRHEILERMSGMRSRDVNWKANRVFGLVYHYSDAHSELVQSAYNMFMSANGLNPMAFRSLQEMEHDVVRISAALFHGNDSVVGTMTSGGTESILLSVLAYRQWARSHRPWVRKPEIVVPESAHAAFYKAGEYFDVNVVSVPLAGDFRADVGAIEKRINKRTIAIVGSAPCYPYGVIDPIEKIAALGIRHHVPVHVDACLGGFLLPFVEKLNSEDQLEPIAPFDFRVPGVTSISADLHKYGYAAKGASVILYAGSEYLRHQFTAATDWCGGIYASPTLAGTRPGGAIAAAWASLHGLGEEGYVENARAIVAATRRFREDINAIPELCVLGNPGSSVMAFGSKSKTLSIYAVGDILESKGWHVDRLQRPESLHMILNAGHGDVVNEFIADLSAAVQHVRAHPEAAFVGSAPMYGLIAKAPMRKLVKRQVLAIIEKMYSAEGGVPDFAASENAEENRESETKTGVPKAALSLMKFQAWIARTAERFSKRP